METRKLTEGALLSALQIIVGFVFISTGIGYGFYMQVMLPIMMVIIYLRCDMKVAALAGMNTLILITFSLGNIVSAIYMSQAVFFGLLCGALIKKRSNVQDDLLLASILGCVFLLILDYYTARLMGSSLLDNDGLDEMVYEIMPTMPKELIQIIFYMSIASVPIMSILLTYIGGLFLGNRLKLLPAIPRSKYKLVRAYPKYAACCFHSRRAILLALIGLGSCRAIWPFATGNYLKALIASSGMVLLYFTLMDFMKLFVQYAVIKLRNPLLVSMLHMLLLFALMSDFKLVSCGIIIMGGIIDLKTNIRERQQGQLRQHILGGERRCQQR